MTNAVDSSSTYMLDASTLPVSKANINYGIIYNNGMYCKTPLSLSDKHSAAMLVDMNLQFVSYLSDCRFYRLSVYNECVLSLNYAHFYVLHCVL